jgi:hypothetical protein
VKKAVPFILNSQIASIFFVDAFPHDAHIKLKAHHNDQHFLITAKLPPSIGTTKSFDFVPIE